LNETTGQLVTIDVMKSPFPGMDPYLEKHWPDVHGSVVAMARGALNEMLPEDLIARSEERLEIESPDWETLHVIRPDVRVYGPSTDLPSSGQAVLDVPIELIVDAAPIKQRFIRILQADDERLLTVIELISPSNKRGQGLEKYLQNRSELLEAGVNVVEVDLVRRGNWSALLRPHVCPLDAITTYRTTVRYPHDGSRQRVSLYPMPLDRPLPPVAIPLRPSDAPVNLDLQPLIESVYVSGRYGRTIDYSRPCDPPLIDEELRMADTFIKSDRKRE